MDIAKIKEGKRVKYAANARNGKCEGTGKVVQVYQTPTGARVVVHDKARNKSVTVRPSQVSPA